MNESYHNIDINIINNKDGFICKDMYIAKLDGEPSFFNRILTVHGNSK